MAKNKKPEGNISQGFDESLSVEKLKTVKDFKMILDKCEMAVKELKIDGVKLSVSLSELKQLYSELESHHGRDVVEPNEKLEKLRQAISEWVEMYHVVVSSVSERSLTEANEEILKRSYQKFSSLLKDVRSLHAKKDSEIPPIPESVPPPIPVSEPVSDIPSFDEIADLVFSREESLRLNPSGDKKDLSSIDQDIVKNIQTRLEKNNQFFNDWLRKNFNSDDKVVKDNFLLMIDKTDPLFKRAYDEVPKARLFVDKWFGEKFNEIKLQVSGDAVLSKSKKLKKEKVSGVVVATTTRQGSSLWGKISSLFDKKSNGREESTPFDDIVSDVEKYLDGEFTDHDESLNFVISDTLISYFKLSNGKKKFIKEIKNNVHYKILKESYPSKWKSIAEKWFDDHKNKWKRGEIKFGKEDEKVKPDLESVDSVSSFDETETSTEVEENFDFEVGGTKVKVGDFFKSRDLLSGFSNLRIKDIKDGKIVVEKFIDSDVGVEEEISEEVWQEDYAPFLILYPEGISFDANSTESVVEETAVKEKINLETQEFLESNNEKFINIITDIVQEKEYQQYPHRAFGVFLNEIKQTEEYHKLLSENKYKINEVELIIREWFYEKYQEEKDKLDPESVAKEIIEVNEQKTDEDLKWEEIYREKREEIERQIEIERQKLNILRTQMLEASRNNLMDISRKENVDLFSKLFGKGSEIKLKAKESLEKYNSIFGQYLSVLSKMIELSGILSEESEFVKNKIEEEIEEVRQLIDQSISDPKMSPSNIEYLKRVFDIFKTHFDKEEVKQQIIQLSQVIETKKDQFLNDVGTQTQGMIERENKEQERSEKMAEFFQLEQVNYSIINLKNFGCKNAEEIITRILSNFINSHKNKEYVSNYFSDVNNLFANLLENGSINDDLSKFNVWLNGRKVSEEQKAEFNQGIVGRVHEILREGVISNLERDRDGVINFSSLEKLIQQQVHREFLSIYRSNESVSEGIIMLRPGTDIIEGLDLDKKQEEEENTNNKIDILNSTEQIKESKLRLVDSRKIGKENRYNFFIGQNLRLKNGSPVLVRDIQSDFIVVMEEDGNLVSIFDDEIGNKLQVTPGLEMSKLSGAESKDQNEWDRLLKSVREKFINKSSDQEVFWEYQDALKQYFEANQDTFEGNYKKFLNQEKQALEQYGRSGVDNVIRILEESLTTAIKSMNNKAKAVKKRAEEKRNNTVETLVSGKTNKADKITQASTSVGAKTPIISSSPSNTSIRGGGGVVGTKSNVETATRRENNNKNRIEFVGQLYDKKMSVYFEGEDKKTNIIISKVENGKISFRSSRKGYHVMSEEEWSRLLSYTELMDSLKKTDEQIRNMEIESTKKVKNSVADLFPEDDEEESDDEKPKGQITPETAKLVEIGLIKTIKVGEGLKKLKDELIKKMTDVKTIDKNFVDGLSSEEKFLVSFVNGQRMNGFLEDKKGDSLKEFYAYSNLDNCNLYIIKDSTGIGLIRHDKPVKNVGGILVEIENGEEHTVHYEIKNDKFILVRD